MKVSSADCCAVGVCILEWSVFEAAKVNWECRLGRPGLANSVVSGVGCSALSMLESTDFGLLWVVVCDEDLCVFRRGFVLVLCVSCGVLVA